MYGIEKKDIGKFAKIINESKYILYIEPKNESKQKGKYFLPTTKTDYRKAMAKVNDIVKYICPDHKIQTPK